MRYWTKPHEGKFSVQFPEAVVYNRQSMAMRSPGQGLLGFQHLLCGEPFLRRNNVPRGALGHLRTPVTCCESHLATPSEASLHKNRSRRAVLRGIVAAITALSFDIHGPQPTKAVCGEPDPYFAHYLDWQEGLARGPGSRTIHYRLVGNRRKEVKAGKFPVLYLGDAGVALASGETLELLGGTDRRVLLTDLLGVGESQPLGKGEFALSRADAVSLARDECLSVLGAVGLSKENAKKVQSLHIVANGFGLEVADSLIQKLADEDAEKSLNINVASVAAEGWAPAKLVQGKEITFEGLQGSRVCAVEGAEGGNLSVVRKLYEPAKGDTGAFMVAAIERIASRVPTIALRTFDTRPLDEKVVGSPLFTVHEFSQSGRIAHLAGTEDVMSTLELYFDKIEGRDEQKKQKTS